MNAPTNSENPEGCSGFSDKETDMNERNAVMPETPPTEVEKESLMSLTPDNERNIDLELKREHFKVLWKEHQQILLARAVPIEYAIRHGLKSIDLKGIKAVMEKYKIEHPWPGLPLHQSTGIKIDYPDCADEKKRVRIRVDSCEIENEEGKVTKIPRYLAQKGLPVVPYFTDEVRAIAGDTSKAIYIVEAPLKALSMSAHGFPAIGLGGVSAGAHESNIRKTTGEIVASKDLKKINCSNRIVNIVYDAGIRDNPMVALGAAISSTAMKGEGAEVRLVVLPYWHAQESDPEDGVFWRAEDQGPDDYIARNGAGAMAKLIEEAIPACPIARVSQALEGKDKTEAVARLLSDLSFQAMVHVGGALVIDQVAALAKKAGVSRKSIVEAAKSFVERLVAKAKEKEKVKEPEWMEQLERNGSDVILGTPANALLVLNHDTRWQGVIAYNQFAERAVLRKSPPWESVTKNVASENSSEIRDTDSTRLMIWLDQNYGMKLSQQNAQNVIEVVAERYAFHPIKEYLQALKWDGVERVAGRESPGLLTTYWGVEDTPYARQVGRWTMISLIARVMQPGAKVDTMLILEGRQGKKKSQSFRALVGAEYFSDTLSDLGSKDSYQDLRGKWVVEMAELDAMRKAEVTEAKKFISKQSDNYRASYGRVNRDVPRQNIFVGTTNESTYLTDNENRRYWPVRCESTIDVDRITQDRDQILAEAYALFEAGERWWAETEEEIALCVEAQSERRATDVWEELLRDALDGKVEDGASIDIGGGHTVDVPATSTRMDEITVASAAKDILNIPTERIHKGVIDRIGKALRAIGWERVRRGTRYDRTWVYVRPDEQRIAMDEAVKAAKETKDAIAEGNEYMMDLV